MTAKARTGTAAERLPRPRRYYAPRRRLDETRAARAPVLRWTKPGPVADAAE